jgi:hypothetical protein
VSGPKNKKNAPAGESGNQRPKRRRERLIRLDDLIPKQDVMGGHQLLFGVTDTTQTTNQNKKEEQNGTEKSDEKRQSS